jgi:hypothetical protein
MADVVRGRGTALIEEGKNPKKKRKSIDDL